MKCRRITGYKTRGVSRASASVLAKNAKQRVVARLLFTPTRARYPSFSRHTRTHTHEGKIGNEDDTAGYILVDGMRLMGECVRRGREKTLYKRKGALKGCNRRLTSENTEGIRRERCLRKVICCLPFLLPSRQHL